MAATASPLTAHHLLRLSEAEKNLVEALAGALGSVVATWTFYPLDTVKTRLQASPSPALQPPLPRRLTRPRAPRPPPRRGTAWRPSAAAWRAPAHSRQRALTQRRTQLRSEGPAALYRGVGVKTAHSVAQSFVYFYAFARLRGAAERRLGRPLGVAATLAVGTLAGWCNVLLTEPLDALATARQTQSAGQDRGKGKEADGAAQPQLQPQPQPQPQQPLRGLYRSLAVSLLLTVNPALQFTAFDQARRRVLAAAAARAGAATAAGRPELSALHAFLLGAASKAFATTLTYPAIRAKVVLQTGGAASLAGAARCLRAREGRGWLLRGLQAQLLKTVLVAALQLMIKEKAFGSAYYLVSSALSTRMRLAERRARARS